VLLLVYVLICAYISAVTLSIELYYKLPEEYEKFNRGSQNYNGLPSLGSKIGAWVITTAASYIMTNFLKFHIILILNNKTTIEFLEKKGEEFESQFNMSPMHNWRQVFGYNHFLWFFPVSWASGHPVGDGVYWPINPNYRPPERNGTQTNQNRGSGHSDNKRLILENNSHKDDPELSGHSSSNELANKENIHKQVNNSPRNTLRFNPEAIKKHDMNFDTVENKKENNTLIVHSQDKNKMLKNTLIRGQ
jgi:hypothetical protein